ncbi:MAG: alpha/beta hydrolase [Clostridia bacterium]|nr:alpha/beta hydrolase [Clostridia bacterium]
MENNELHLEKLVDKVTDKVTDRINDKVSNQNVMAIIKKMHATVEKVDIPKQRHMQDNYGVLLGASKDVEFEEIQIGDISAEWTRLRHSHRYQPVILYCHGGGYVAGSKKYARSVISKLVEATSMPTLSFDYRLAPEHPFPAAIEDVVSVWDYLTYQGYGAENIIVAGDSAGGNLALELLLYIKSKQRILPKGLILLSPWTDMTNSGKSIKLRAEADPILCEAYLNNVIQLYADGQKLDSPELSPLYADFGGFPPTYIQVGENEVLLDDSTRLYQRLLLHKVLTRMSIYEGMWHVFQMAPFKKSYLAIQEAAEFIFEICK